MNLRKAGKINKGRSFFFSIIFCEGLTILGFDLVPSLCGCFMVGYHLFAARAVGAAFAASISGAGAVALHFE
ncbi:hypothetical protein F4810DRAFT_694879 [Camillea tinctor]|nr:hypothetical protein F4810DRAFT_694879 [Camillea tinctor]